MKNPETTSHFQILERNGLVVRLPAIVGLLAIFGGELRAVADQRPPISLEAQETQKKIKSARLDTMKNNGDMAEGFSRSLIKVSFGGEEQLMGSFFAMENDHAKADFVTAKSLIRKGRADFEAIHKVHRNTVLITAGAYLAPGGEYKIKGMAIKDGEAVGENNPTDDFNGLLVIKNGIPEIVYLSEIVNKQAFFEQARREGWSLFQQTSFIRPGGEFQSKDATKWKLRFFVEVGKKKGVMNFSEPITYAEAVTVMKKMGVEKAIGLDTGMVEEGYFYNKAGTRFMMGSDEGNGFTNVLVLYSG